MNYLKKIKLKKEEKEKFIGLKFLHGEYLQLLKQYDFQLLPLMQLLQSVS